MSPCEERITTAFTFASLLDACASRLDMPLLTTATSLNVSIRCLSSQSGVLPCCIRKYWAVRYMDTDRYTDSVRDANGKWKDRKSTRLNSSHRTISYAVFCLKKKK